VSLAHASGMRPEGLYALDLAEDWARCREAPQLGRLALDVRLFGHGATRPFLTQASCVIGKR
jgi:hypothetical protein